MSKTSSFNSRKAYFSIAEPTMEQNDFAFNEAPPINPPSTSG
jgi:hypothetical protein